MAWPWRITRGSIATFLSIVRTSCRAATPSITVNPPSGLMDEAVSITVDGLTPHRPVSVRSSLRDRNKLFEAVGHFVADQDGRVAVNKQPSVGGSYTGLETMGLFWSLRPAPGQKAGIRFAKTNVEEPVEFTFSVYNGHQKLESLVTAQPATQPVAITQTRTQRWYMKEVEVDRIKVRSGRIRGVLFKPKGPGPFPGVIDMFGLAGGVIEYRAALLASHGFAAFALPYFGYEDLPRNVSHLEFEYFEEATNWLSLQSFVSPSSIGVLGLSLGGAIALEMAARLQQIKAVVSLSSLPLIGVYMTYRGEQLDSSHLFDISSGYMGEEGYVMKDITIEKVRDLPDEQLISIEDSKAHFLYGIGEDDENMPSVECARRIVQKLRSHGRQNYELLSYPGAGHLLEPPYQPVGRHVYNAPLDIVLDFGGETKQHAHACQDAWVKSLAFLRKHLIVEGDGTHIPTTQQGALHEYRSSNSSKL